MVSAILDAGKRVEPGKEGCNGHIGSRIGEWTTDRGHHQREGQRRGGILVRVITNERMKSEVKM